MVRPSEPSDYDEEALKEIRWSRDYKTAHKELIKRFAQVATAYTEKHPERLLHVTSIYIAKDAVPKGRCCAAAAQHAKTPARALHFVVLEYGRAVTEEAAYWPLVALFHKHELRYSGDGGLVWDCVGLPE